MTPSLTLAMVVDTIAGTWPAGLMMLGLGSSFALTLLVASRKLHVEVDPKIEAIEPVLPGANCGACGYAGCGAYAKAVVADPGLIGRCAPGGSEVSVRIGEILSLQIEDDGIPHRPVVHCNAHTEDKVFLARYAGIPSCTAANALTNVQACRFGCLGMGDCVRACQFGALRIEDGLATVDYDLCTGCAACVQACPRDLIEMVPFAQDTVKVVACNSRENGKTVKAQCSKGCIGCSICQRKCGAFAVSDFLATLSYRGDIDEQAMSAAVEKCPTKVIVTRGRITSASKTLEA